MPDDLAVKNERDGTRKLRDLEDLKKQGEEARRPFEASWFLNLAFYQGDHWWAWAKDKFARPQLEPWRVLFTDNRVQPAVASEVAKLTKNRPVWDAVPASGDDEALEDTLLANRVMEAKWEDLGLQQQLEDVCTWSRVCGSGFWKITWDPLASGTGTEVAIDPETREPIPDPGSGELITRDNPNARVLEQLAAQQGIEVPWESVGQGDVKVNVRSPFDLYVDPLAGSEGLISARWVIEEAVRSPDELQRRFKLDKAPEADASAVGGLVEARMPGARSDTGQKIGTRVWELWERPSLKFPKGRHAVWCKDHILVLEENPTKDAGLPYAMCVGRRIPGRFWPMSLADQLRPLNMELNKTRSQMRENAARIGNPPLMVPSDQQFTWTGVPGEVVKVDPFAPNTPGFMQVPQLPGYIQNEPALIENSMREVAHQSEVSRGQVPAGVTAASAIQLLQEADQTIIAMDAQAFERFVTESGRMAMDLIAAHYRTDRLIQIAGEDEDWDIESFRSGQFKRDVPTVQVKTGSMIPRSTAARQAQMDFVFQTMLQHGYQPDRLGMSEFLRQYEVGGLEKLMGTFSEDASQIAGENRRMKQGAPVEVNEWDDHEAHMRGHERVMKSKRWQTFDDQTRQLFLAHWQEHQQALQAKQQEEMAMQMQAQAAAGAAQPQQGGSPPSGPAGSPSAPSGPPVG